MRKLAMLAAATLAATAIPTAASAQVTLLNGDNSLPSTAMVHLDASFDNSDVLTVHGITDSGVQILFTGNVNINGTGGAGYAQIDPVAGGGIWNTLTITCGNCTGFTDYEFSMQYDGSNQVPIDLRIAYALVGGGGGEFNFVDGPNNDPLDNLRFTNNGARDFRLDADAGFLIQSITLTGRFAAGANIGTLAPIVQEKQNDVFAAQPPAVPEPATWAMMLMGFGATGVAMRRSRRRKGLLTQIA